ncbi:MAG TPA: sialidase family protein, partial [Thermoanaerobaculia bacterium]|nr:sialidase family protein [Thermoanaerobaculia bacterium]
MRTLRILVWAAFAPSLLVRSLSAEQGWEPDRRLTRNGAASQTSINFARSIAADERGRVHAAWADERDGNREIYYQRSIDGGVSWGPPARLTVAPGSSYNPSIAAQGDRVHVAWWDTRGGAPHVYHKRSLDGGATWEEDRQVVASPGSGAHPSLALAGDRVHIVYVDGRDGQSEVYYARSLDRGATWAVPMRLSAPPWNSYTPTVAAVGDSVYVAWTDTRDQMQLDHFEEEYFRRSLDGGATWEAEVRLTSDPASSWAPSLAADGSDVWVAWFDDRGGDWEIYVKHSTDRGATWSADRRLTHSAGASLRPSLARRGSALHVVFWDTRDANEEVYWLTSPDRGATWGDSVRLTNDNSGSLLPSVAAAASGVHVVWTDGRSGNSEIYYKRLPGDPVAAGNGRIAFSRSLAG